MVTDGGQLPIESNVKNKGGGGEGLFLPICFGILPIFFVQKCFGMMVVGSADHDIGFNKIAIGPYSLYFSFVDQDFFNGSPGSYPYAKFPRQTLNGLDNLVHAPFGMPGSQPEIGIVHKAIKGWGMCRFGSQKKDREFQYRNQFGIFKPFPNFPTYGPKKPIGSEHRIPGHQFHG